MSTGDGRSNKSTDMDVLSAGFACLLSAGHLQRLGHMFSFLHFRQPTTEPK